MRLGYEARTPPRGRDPAQQVAGHEHLPQRAHGHAGHDDGPGIQQVPARTTGIEVAAAISSSASPEDVALSVTAARGPSQRHSPRAPAVPTRPPARPP